MVETNNVQIIQRMYLRYLLITLGNWEQISFILPFYSSNEDINARK